MLNNLTQDKLKLYLAQLEQSKLNSDQIRFKINSIEKFIDWAIEKGYLDAVQVDQMRAEIANFKKTYLVESLPRDPNHIYTSKKINVYIADFLKDKRFSNIPYYPYSIIGVLLIFVFSIISLFSPNKEIKSRILAAPSSKNILSFQGKITDKLGNPVTDKTDVVFSIYNSATSTSPIYTGACTGMSAITPDLKGSIDVRIGQDCNMKPLPDSLFSNNKSLYLGIKAGSDPEMQPRKQLANVDFSSNSNKLQGLATGQTSSSIPFINDQGDMLIEADQASITATSKSTNFSINSANLLNLRAQNDVIISSLVDGGIHLQTGQKNLQDRLFISPSGNIGINGAEPTFFNVQVAGDIGPNSTGVYNIGSFANQWGAVYGQKFYQDGNEVCDMSNNCSSLTEWSSLTSPQKSVELKMGDNQTFFTYGNSTSSNNLFNLTDSTDNTGTGYLMNLSTSPGSQLNPFHISTAGIQALTVTSSGFVGIGTVSPNARLRVNESGTRSSTSYAGYLDNSSNNTSTDGINKYGLYISSTGNFIGGSGDSTKNYGIYIASTTGADTNYDIYAASGAYLTTGGVWTNASSRDLKENFTQVDPDEILRKITQLDMTTWNYKSENNSIKHLGPIAEDFYSLFHLGNSDKSISTIDPAGIALVGIQALNTKVKALEAENNLASVNNTGDVIITGPASDFTYDGIDQQDATDSYSLQVGDQLITSIKNVGTLISASVKTGFVEAQNIVVKNSAFVRNLSAEKIKSPVIEGETISASKEANLTTIKTDQIAPLHGDSVNINLEDKGELAKVIIKGLENKTVTTIDAQGNILTDGNITSRTATVSGSLTAKSIQTDNFQSTNVSANTATFSGELTADTIHSKALDQINNKVSSNESSLSSVTAQVNSVQQLLANIKNTNPSEVTPTNITVDNFTVNTSAMLYKATITDSLFVGSLIERSNSILSLNSDLNISSLGSVSFFENAVVITKDGSITTNGTVSAGSLAIKDANQQTVASINTEGAATFKKLSLDKYVPDSPSTVVIAASDNLSRNGQFAPAMETTQQSAGIGIVPANNREVIIYNETIQDSSLVYLTPTSSNPGVNLTVVEKISCSNSHQPCRPYFKVGTDKDVSSPLSFNWLIIN